MNNENVSYSIRWVEYRYEALNIKWVHNLTEAECVNKHTGLSKRASVLHVEVFREVPMEVVNEGLVLKQNNGEV